MLQYLMCADRGASIRTWREAIPAESSMQMHLRIGQIGHLGVARAKGLSMLLQGAVANLVEDGLI